MKTKPEVVPDPVDNPVEPVASAPPPEPTLTLNKKDIDAVIQFRANVWAVIQRLEGGSEARAKLVESLLLYQLNVRPELCP